MTGLYLGMVRLSLAVAVTRAVDPYHESMDSRFHQQEQLSAHSSKRWERPPAGWNAWFAFDKSVTQEGILRNAEALVRTGLRDAGCALGPLHSLACLDVVPCLPVQALTLATATTVCRHVRQRR
jgi:hypothetical protein